MKTLTYTWRTFCVVCLLITLLLATGCTVVMVEKADGTKVTVADVHVVGEAMSLDGALKDTGEIHLNRTRGSALEGVSVISEQFSPVGPLKYAPFGPVRLAP